MKKIKYCLRWFIGCLAATPAVAAMAQSFAPGQILTAAQLNAAFASVLPLTGGTLTGPLTAPTVTVTTALNTAHAAITGGTITGVSPIPLASGGTNAATASAALANLGGLPLAGGTLTGPLTVPTLLPTSIQANSAPNNGPLNIKMSAAAQPTTAYFENFSTADDQGASPWNTPNYVTIRDVYKGTRGTNHGNTANAGDGNGPVIDFQSWSRRGTYLDAVTLNGGLESAAANAECSDLDINGYLAGSVVGMFAIDACGGGLTSTPTVFPGGDITWNLGWSTRRWNNGYFGGTVNMATAAVSGNAFISGSAFITGQGGMPLYDTTGTGVNGPHMVQGSIALASGSATVTLSGSAAFTSASSYVCTANDTTAANPVRVSQGSGTSITFTGTGTDTVRFLCTGS